MFSYVDKSIREGLEAQGLLKGLDKEGRVVEPIDKSAFISVLGPVPIPRIIDGSEVILDWFPFVRRTELSTVLDSANEVANGGGGAFRDLLSNSMLVNSVFALPGFRDTVNPLVRVHSCCLTGDVFGSRRCDCGPQLDAAFAHMKADGGGAVLYMSGHEGRGIGLWAKAITYLLQDGGHDTYEANTALGLPEDSREFSDAAVVLRFLLENRAIRLLSNNPDKSEQLVRNGQEVSDQVPLVAGVCEHNKKYMEAKREKGHEIGSDF